MILTRTPFRISLFGGGTDMPAWFNSNGGAVISFSIDKYCHLSIRELPPYFDYKYRAVYSKVETAVTVDQIEHPAIRESIKKYGMLENLEIQYHGDLPARSGVGSSSAFAVSIINGLSKLNNKDLSKKDLASMAIELEQKVIGENVGSQDQVACTFGGINKIIFTSKDSWEVRPLNLSLNRINEIEERCFLTYTGIDRISSDVSKGLLENLSKSEKVLKKTMDLVGVAENLISENADLDILGDLLQEATKLKFEANPSAQTPSILNFISQGIKSGALGGKILGAGGGGFCLFWLKKDDKQRFKSTFKLGKEVPFKIDFSGASIIASQPWKGF
jgi:D-glycero-alpha-D-manno-heptose-7-phosphate kinase